MNNENIDWLGSKAKKLIAEGRGRGELDKYIPWTLTTEFSSKGRATRIKGIKTNRIHHLHSDNQLRAFLIFEWCPKVCDIRETFPLIDIMETISNSDIETLKFGKFTNKNNEQAVITTNFLLTVKDDEGKPKFEARTVKNTTELNRSIAFEKLEIERRYWQAKGVNWKVITDKQLTRQYCKNIEWVRETLLVDNLNNQIDKEMYSERLIEFIISNQESPLKQILPYFEQRYFFDKGVGLYLFRYLIAKRKIYIDMNNKVDMAVKAKDIILKII
jgi:hypothetical protein